MNKRTFKSMFGLGSYSINFKDDPESPTEGGGGEAGDGSVTGDAGNERPAEPSADDKSDDEKPKGNKPSDAEAKLLQEIMQKKDQNRELKGELEKVKKQLKQFEGVDVEQVKTMLQEANEREVAELEKQKDWERLRDRMASQHQKELEEKDALIAELKAVTEKSTAVIDKLTIGHAFDTSNFIQEEMVLPPTKARVIYGDHFDVIDGQVVAYDKPRGAGDRTPLVDGSGKNLGFSDALKAIVDSDPDKDAVLKSKIKPGAGSTTTHGKAPENKPRLVGKDRIAASLSQIKRG